MSQGAFSAADRRNSLQDGAHVSKTRRIGRRHIEPLGPDIDRNRVVSPRAVAIGELHSQCVTPCSDLTPVQIPKVPNNLVNRVSRQGSTRDGIHLVAPRDGEPGREPLGAHVAPRSERTDELPLARLHPNGAHVLGCEAASQGSRADREGERAFRSWNRARRIVVRSVRRPCISDEQLGRQGKRVGVKEVFGWVCRVAGREANQDESRKPRRASGCALFLGSFVVGAFSCGGPARTTLASSSVYVRADTDRTTVVSPEIRAAAAVGERVTVEASEVVDAWTGASIDVITAATGTIRERRFETNAQVGYRGDLWAFALGLRHSFENDYGSLGGSLRLAADVFQRNTTLALVGFGSTDAVGRAGDPGFRRGVVQLGGRVSVTQVLTRSTLAELQWESVRLEGYQASPYRFVGVGGDGVCGGRAVFCLPEHVPDGRLRNAPSIRLRQALSTRASLGCDYRFYFDSWGLQSHTIEPDLAWLMGRSGTLSVSFRHHTQGRADFYRARYLGLDGSEGFFTRDRKLSTFSYHGVGLSYVHDLRLRDEGTVLQLGARAAFTRFHYLEFLGLERVSVLETTAYVALRFE